MNGLGSGGFCLGVFFVLAITELNFNVEHRSIYTHKIGFQQWSEYTNENDAKLTGLEHPNQNVGSKMKGGC